MIVFTYFCLLRNCTHSVKCVSASRKCDFCKSAGYIQKIPKGYKETKQCSIDVVTQLIGTDPLNVGRKQKKKDDLSDVIIQAFAYCDKVV